MPRSKLVAKLVGWRVNSVVRSQKYMKQFLCILIFLPLAGCLKFGDNVNLSGKEINKITIQRIENTSKIKLQNDTLHLEYSYFGDTIDPYWLYKGELTPTGYESVFKNIVFSELDTKNENDIFMGTGTKKWWRPKAMKNATFKKKTFQNGSMLTCSIGKEVNKHIVYISYHTM